MLLTCLSVWQFRRCLMLICMHFMKRFPFYPNSSSRSSSVEEEGTDEGKNDKDPRISTCLHNVENSKIYQVILMENAPRIKTLCNN